MADQVRHDHTYTGVWVHKRNTVLVTAFSDRLAAEEEEFDHTLVFRQDAGAWSHYAFAKAVPSVCTVSRPSPGLFVMAIDGEVTLYAPGGKTIEIVDDGDEGPSELVQLRCIRPIGDRIYVAGLARHVYRRTGPNAWSAIDAGVFVPRAQRVAPVGFNTIDGLREDAIYAAGYLGEIWFFNGKGWVQEDSPTNVALNCLTCVSEGQVCIGGMAGIVIRGSSGSWEIIEQDETEEDFWGSTLFRERVYLANYDGVFVLEGDTLRRVDFGLDDDLSTAYLHANDGVMWSVGQKDLASTEDGVHWIRVTKPN